MNCRRCGDRGYRIEGDGETAVARVCPCRSPCPRCGDSGWTMELTDGRPVSRPCDCRHLRRNVSRYNEAGIPTRMLLCTLEKYETRDDAQKLLKKNLELFRRNYRPGTSGLLLWGRPGTGKTHLACSLVSHFTLECGYTARFQDFFHLLSDLKAAYAQKGSEDAILQPLVDVDVLVIDELGKGRASEWEISVLDQLVSRRYNAKKTIVATTNFDAVADGPVRLGPNGGPDGNGGTVSGDGSLPRLVDRIDERIYSRLREMCVFHRVDGPDWRRR